MCDIYSAYDTLGKCCIWIHWVWCKVISIYEFHNCEYFFSIALGCVWFNVVLSRNLLADLHKTCVSVCFESQKEGQQMLRKSAFLFCTDHCIYVFMEFIWLEAFCLTVLLLCCIHLAEVIDFNNSFLERKWSWLLALFVIIGHPLRHPGIIEYMLRCPLFLLYFCNCFEQSQILFRAVKMKLISGKTMKLKTIEYTWNFIFQMVKQICLTYK